MINLDRVMILFDKLKELSKAKSAPLKTVMSTKSNAKKKTEK